MAMKKHFLSLFDHPNRWFTFSFFLAALMLIVASQVVGINDNFAGITMLLSGMVFLFFSLLHPWKNSGNYGLLATMCIGLICLTFLLIYILSLMGKSQYISEGIVMAFIGLFCIPGILTGIIGAVIRANRK
jgi:hypothetical protein